VFVGAGLPNVGVFAAVDGAVAFIVVEVAHVCASRVFVGIPSWGVCNWFVKVTLGIISEVADITTGV